MAQKQLEYQKRIIREELLENTKEITPPYQSIDLYKGSPRRKRIMQKLFKN